MNPLAPVTKNRIGSNNDQSTNTPNTRSTKRTKEGLHYRDGCSGRSWTPAPTPWWAAGKGRFGNDQIAQPVASLPSPGRSSWAAATATLAARAAADSPHVPGCAHLRRTSFFLWILNLWR